MSEFQSDAKIILEALDAYSRESSAGEIRVIDQERMEKIISDLDLSSFVKTGGLSGERLSKFMEDYLRTATRLHHPGYFAHQCAVPHPTGALGSLVDGFTNNAMAIYEMGPGAASIEYFIINWMLEKVGWRPAPLSFQEDDGTIYGGGVLTHGGSLANLTGLVAARSRIAPTLWQDGIPGDLALLASPGSHYSVSRSAGILGIGSRSVYPLEVDNRGVILPDCLPNALDRLERDGKRAFALVANACSTAVGLYDPLEEIGAFCRERNLWLHVDGAHGASALVSQNQRGLMKGIELADSLSWDAHKLLRTPTVCTALLVRDYRTLDNAFQQQASYIFHEKEQPGIDSIHRTVECTKAGLGLRMFFVLAAMGEKGLEAYIDQQFQLALDAYDLIQEQPDFECPVKPEANILCFRHVGDDHTQISIRDRLIEDGDFHLSTTTFNGRRYLRLAIMSPASRIGDIRRLLERIREIAEAKSISNQRNRDLC